MPRIPNPQKEPEMSNINTGRVVLGGLLAGLVLNIGEFVLNEVVLGSQMRTWFAQHNFKEPAGSFIAIAVVLTFVPAMIAVFTPGPSRGRMSAYVRTMTIPRTKVSTTAMAMKLPAGSLKLCSANQVRI